MRRGVLASVGLVSCLLAPKARAGGVLGYYREPALHRTTLARG